ncbi:hypothetical protein CYMTET_38719 [Cymbomonas tetramitiformis]|uniref:SEA domain-containing protein n=1 Tax=Cymbomonas tetramitiformis TaxID=36881 RepID=A0AAE0F6B5_9CHLO|nr:hypothetical protein CYMTET_38719 [Cymbomonas tetramitiformis]
MHFEDLNLGSDFDQVTFTLEYKAEVAKSAHVPEDYISVTISAGSIVVDTQVIFVSDAATAEAFSEKLEEEDQIFTDNFTQTYGNYSATDVVYSVLSSPPPSPSPPPQDQDSNSDGLGVGAIVGIVIAAVVAVAAGIVFTDRALGTGFITLKRDQDTETSQVWSNCRNPL